MRRKKMIAKPRYIKSLGLWLAIFWIITAIAFGELYFLTDRKCKQEYEKEYEDIRTEVVAKVKELSSVHEKYVKYRELVGTYSDFYPEQDISEYMDYTVGSDGDPFEKETNNALSEFYKLMYDNAYEFNMNVLYETIMTQDAMYPLYFDNIGAMAEYEYDDETHLLRACRPISTYTYTSGSGEVAFPAFDPVDPAGRDINARVIERVNEDFGVSIWNLGDIVSDDTDNDNVTQIRLLEFYEYPNDRTFVPMKFEYQGKIYVNTFDPSPEDSYVLRTESDDVACYMNVYRRPEGCENAEYTNVYTARTLPSLLSITMDVKLGRYKGFYETMPSVVVKNALVWFAVSTVIAVVVAYIAYLRERSTYKIFEYRKKVTDSMAHDLKTPLAAMSAYAENLEENINTEKRAYYSARIRENIDFMNKTVEGILDFSKSEIGKSSSERKEVDVRGVFEKEYKETEELFKRKDIKVDITGDLKIRSDEEMLRQAFRNLIGNAEKYARQGSTVEVKIDKSRMTISNLTDVKIKSVRDLKKPFVKGEISRGSTSGTGLGLSIADNCLLSTGHRLELEFENETFKAIVIW